MTRPFRTYLPLDLPVDGDERQLHKPYKDPRLGR